MSIKISSHSGCHIFSECTDQQSISEPMVCAFVHQLLKLNLRAARTSANWFVLHSRLPHCRIAELLGCSVATEPSNQHQLIWSVDQLLLALSAARDDYDYRRAALKRRSLRKLYCFFPRQHPVWKWKRRREVGHGLNPFYGCLLQFARLIKSRNRPVEGKIWDTSAW